MMMELLDQTTTMMIKGKRTKRRHRPLSPLRLTIGNSSSGGDGGGGVVQERMATISTNESTTTEEEEEMANCLILLAQGIRNNDDRRRWTTAAPPQVEIIDPNNYQCKTCDRRFHSFQALGGHRASHKKTKLIAGLIVPEENHNNNCHDQQQNIGACTTTNLSLQLANGTAALFSKRVNKVHECSICGAEFSSGQALGGHMRRHRAFTTAANNGASSSPLIHADNSSSSQKPRNIFHVDLNLPAPEDHDHDHDRRELKHSFSNSKEQVIVFSSSSSLVNCHY